jgi:hypothetical protein
MGYEIAKGHSAVFHLRVHPAGPRPSKTQSEDLPLMHFGDYILTLKADS